MPPVAQSLHDGYMKCDNWHPIFRAYIVINNTSPEAHDWLDNLQSAYTFQNTFLWFENVDDAMLFYIRFS